MIFYEDPTRAVRRKRNGGALPRSELSNLRASWCRGRQINRVALVSRRRAGRSILAPSLTSRYCDYIRVCANVIYIDGLVSACQAFNPFTVFDIHTDGVWQCGTVARLLCTRARVDVCRARGFSDVSIVRGGDTRPRRSLMSLRLWWITANLFLRGDTRV